MDDLKVFTIDLAGFETPPPAWLAMLDDSERERAARFRRPEDHLAFAATHTLKRLALAAERPGEHPADLRFCANAFGKPTLADHRRPCFNLSHTTGLVALAVSRQGPVGVDVEVIDEAIATSDLARSTFTPAEVAVLEGEADRIRAFFALWTAKEAVVKAEGQGLSLPLEAIFVGETEASGPSGLWRLWRAEPRSGYLLALAWSGPERGEAPAVASHLLDAADLTVWAGTGCPPRRERSDFHA